MRFFLCFFPFSLGTDVLLVLLGILAVVVTLRGESGCFVNVVLDNVWVFIVDWFSICIFCFVS